MKLFFIKKKKIPVAFYLMILMLILSVFSLNFAVTSAMAQQGDMPIFHVDGVKNSVAVTVNADRYINLDKLEEITDGAKITVFLSEYYCMNYCNDVVRMAEDGFSLGILDRSMKGLSKNQINDILAYRIENLSFTSKVNSSLVRFENNLYDATCVNAVYDVDLFPVQWACDASAEDFTSGDIILVQSIEELKNTIKKVREAGFRLVTVDELLLNRAESELPS